MNELSTSTLSELIAKRRKCLTQLREIGLRQGELVAAGNMSDLLRLCGAKQQLIVAMQALESQLAPFQNEDPERRVWASTEARGRCADDAEACRLLVQEVMAMEQAGERQMTVWRGDVAHQLRSVNSAGRVRDAYQANK